ncbi:hypothetical protein GDO81_028550 [Engystomops pustulosus]|uniref:Nanos homolog 1 n=1 Tax=Engystomops pustulosus TaxID=76066 RepID=A0AAV6ZDR4_ENGPU|nr:hypothetical protein GDO81_028550 [Engystomops pustulosus]
MAFDMWRDYLGLNAILRDILGSSPKDPDLSQCSFCKHNGEAPSLYSAHSLKNSSGRVLCPVLRSYVCPQCGATGDKAHTRRFCPLTRDTYTSVYQSSCRKPEGRAAK